MNGTWTVRKGVTLQKFIHVIGKMAEGVYLRRGVLGGNQKFLFWVRPLKFVYISLFLSTFVSISICGGFI